MKLEPISAQNHSAVINQEDLPLLQFSSSLIPKLQGQHDRLAYHKSIKEERVTKPEYRAYLDMIASNFSRIQHRIATCSRSCSAKEVA